LQIKMRFNLDCKTVVFFANAGDRQYANARLSGASVKKARENGERQGSRASQARIALTALRAFRKRLKTTVLQSRFNQPTTIFLLL